MAKFRKALEVGEQCELEKCRLSSQEYRIYKAVETARAKWRSSVAKQIQTIGKARGEWKALAWLLAQRERVRYGGKEPPSKDDQNTKARATSLSKLDNLTDDQLRELERLSEAMQNVIGGDF